VGEVLVGGGEGRVIFIPIFPRSFLETAWGLCQCVRLAGGEDEFAELALAPDPSSLELGESWRTPEGDGGMKTILFKPRDPETRPNVSVISWPMKRLTIDVPIDLHIRLKTGCAMRGEKIADVVRVLIEREFPPQS
jgi:hypothetical protein